MAASSQPRLPVLFLAGVAVIALVIIALIIGVRIGQGEGGGPGEDGGERTANLEPPPTAAEQTAFSEALNADEQAVVSEVVEATGVVPAPGQVSPDDVVVIDWDTFDQGEPGIATVAATVDGDEGGPFVLLLVREANQWRLLAAERQP